MIKFFKKVIGAVGRFFSKVGAKLKMLARTVFNVATIASIALSGAASSFVYFSGAVVATLLGLPITATGFAICTALAMWGTLFYREEAERERLIRGIYIVRTAASIMDVYDTARGIRDERRLKYVS